MTKSLAELEGLIGEVVPRAFPAEISWRLVSTAFLARLGDMLRSMQILIEGEQHSSALLVLRTIYEHTVIFCWLAIEPETRLQRWIDNSERERGRAFKEAGELFDLPPPEDLDMDQAAGIERFAPLTDMASEADRHWSERLPAFRAPEKGPGGILSLRGLYTAVYRRLSRAAHGEVETMDPVVQVTASQIVVSREETVGRRRWDTLSHAIPLVCFSIVVFNHQHPGQVPAIEQVTEMMERLARIDAQQVADRAHEFASGKVRPKG